MKTIIDTINSYMPKSADRLKSEQVYYIPQVRSDQVAYAVKEYIVGSERKILNQINQIGPTGRWSFHGGLEISIHRDYITKRSRYGKDKYG